MANNKLKMYIITNGVNPSHLSNATPVYGYQNAVRAYQMARQVKDPDYTCIVLMGLTFGPSGLVTGRKVKHSRGLNPNQIGMVQRGEL